MTSAAAKALVVLRKREEFLAIAKRGRKWVAPGLILQMQPAPIATAPKRYGLTASGKIGGAVVRNRARRRLRALVVELFPLHAAAGHDYVVIARATTASRAFAALRQDLVTALQKLEAWRESSS